VAEQESRGSRVGNPQPERDRCEGGRRAGADQADPSGCIAVDDDVLRALAKRPEALEVFFAEVDEAAGADARLDAFAAKTRAEFSDHDAIEARARRVVERMALCLQGSLLVRHAPPAVADAFCAARLGATRA
jgi:hypothetical protein